MGRSGRDKRRDHEYLPAGCGEEGIMTLKGRDVMQVADDSSMPAAIKIVLRSVVLAAQLFVSAQEFLTAKKPDVPSCLILDVRLPGMSGLDLQKDLKAAGNDIPIIFISAHGDIPMAVRAMKSGAVEFLTKP